MFRFGCSKKTLAALLFILSLSVILILNTQLKASPRRHARFEMRQPLSLPLTIDLSKNVTYINLPDANNELHQYRLERVHNEDDDSGNRDRVPGSRGGAKEEAEEVMKASLSDDEDEEFGDQIDGEDKKDLERHFSEDTVQRLPGDWQNPANRPGQVVGHNVLPSRNVSKSVKTDRSEISYLLRVHDPRSPRMISKIMTKLPQNVRREMTYNIRMAEARSGIEFQKLPPIKQWEVIYKVFGSNGYEQRFPDVINIGVKKSGTNAMGFFLPQHPQIVHSTGNEVHYFDWQYDHGLDYYKSRMGFAKPNQLVFEKTPRYFVTREVPGRIKKDLLTNPKFILCVRDPISRLVSDFRHESELKLRKEFKKNRLKYSSRTGEFEGERLRREIMDNWGEVNASNELVDTSVYAKHFKNWLRYYPPEQILVVDQDKMEKDVYTEMKRLEAFLGLKPHFKPSMFYFDKDRNGICLREVTFAARNCPAKSTPSVLPKAAIDPVTLAKLKEFYRPFNQEFSQLTGMRFSWAD